MSQHKKGTFATVLWLMRTTKDLLAPLALASVFSCLTRLISLSIYVLAGTGLLKVLGLDEVDRLQSLSWGWLVGLIIILGLAKGALRYLEQYVGHRVAFLSLARLRRRMYAAFERQAPFSVATKNSGSLLARATSDIDKVEVFFAHTLPPAVAAVVVSGLATWGTWIAFGQEPALILLGAYILVGLIVPALGVRRLRSNAATTAATRGAQNQLFTEAMAGVEVLHSFHGGNKTLQNLRESSIEANTAALSTGKITAVRATLTQLVMWGSLLTLFIVLGTAGQLGALVIVVCALVPSFEAVRTVDGFILGLQDSLASARRLHATDTYKPTIADPVHAVELPESGELKIQDLGICYGPMSVLQGVDLSLKPGEMVALVGASGSGKSSLASALVRAIEYTGTISFGGVDITTASLDELRQKIILVAQESLIVRGTVRDNLLLGREDISDEQLISVLEELGLGDWLAGQKSGLDTRLGDRATRLSGGQRQRLALARALIRQPAVLIMDESSSALDAANEQLVLQAVERRRLQGMSVVMISHRLATAGRAQLTMVIDQGVVAESGRASELLANEESLFSQMAIREVDQILLG
ncbi:amino acid ABC transporter ATP-binding/permease protein [Glutamicibacter sp.]|uniref:amino acid ABC transporter ATP-binding/permease protein n=1 Tax=Glutamicibacter sp. TaxID=1931995 RepID=UPI002FE3106C